MMTKTIAGKSSAGQFHGPRQARLCNDDETEPGETSPLFGFDAGNAPRKPTAVPFDDALRMAKFGRFNIYLIVVSGIIMATSIIELLSISFVLPASECEMRFSSTQKGILSGVGFGGIIVSSYVWGFLSDTRGRKAVIVPSLLMAFGFTVLSSLSPNYWTLVLFRFMHGVSISGSSAAVFAYLAEFHTSANRAKAIMYASVVFGSASILMPIVAWAIINETWSLPMPGLGIAFRPWRLFIVAIGLPSLVSALALLPVPESPKFVLSLGKQSETVAILQWIYRANGGRMRCMPHVGSICEEDESIEMRVRRERYDVGGGVGHRWRSVLRSMWMQTAPLFQGVFLRSTLIASAMQFGNYVNTNGMYMWFPDTVNRVIEFVQHNPNATATVCEILQWSGGRTKSVVVDDDSGQRMNGNASGVVDGTDGCVGSGSLESETFSYTFGLEVLYAVGFALIAVIISRVGKCTILVTLHIVFAACGYAIMFLVNPMVSLYLYLVVLLIGLAIPVLNAATIDLYPTSIRGMAVCLTVMMGRLGGMFGVNMVAVLIENHCQMTFGISATICLACGLMTFFIPNIMKNDASTTSTPTTMITSTATTSATAMPVRDEQLQLLDVATVDNSFKIHGKTLLPQMTQ